MFGLDLSKFINKKNFWAILITAHLLVNIFLIWQTTNHLPTQIERNRQEIRENRQEFRQEIQENRQSIDRIESKIDELNGLIKGLLKQMGIK